jgi:hypothetical protein
MFPTKVVEKIKTHVLYITQHFSENRAVYEIMSKNMVEPERPQKTIRFACFVNRTTLYVVQNSRTGFLVQLPFE